MSKRLAVLNMASVAIGRFADEHMVRGKKRAASAGSVRPRRSRSPFHGCVLLAAIINRAWVVAMG